MIIGIIGLGFILLRNFNQRKKEFALMLAVGFQAAKIRRMIISEQLLILFAGSVIRRSFGGRGNFRFNYKLCTNPMGVYVTYDSCINDYRLSSFNYICEISYK